MDHRELFDLEYTIEKAAVLSQILCCDSISVTICGGGVDRKVVLMDDVNGFIDEIERYKEKLLESARKRGYTGDLSEVVLD